MIELEREWQGGRVPFQVRIADIINFWPIDTERTILEIRQTGQVVALASRERIKRLVQLSMLGSLIEGDA